MYFSVYAFIKLKYKDSAGGSYRSVYYFVPVGLTNVKSDVNSFIMVFLENKPWFKNI